MVVPVDLPQSEELYVQLRNKFLESLNSENYDDYEEADIERIRNDDNYCKRFIVHKHDNLEEALKMAHEALKWRKSFGVKDVTQASIPLEFFQAKAVFPYNKDKEDKPIIMILVRYHRKVPEFTQVLRKFVIYWVELMEERTNGGQMTVIMSCAGAGLSNLDLDLIKFLITLFRSYYPDSLAHILIYEMPWILNPAWKIIKAWLPEDFVDKITFVNKTSIQDYVSEDNLPLEMGGTNATEYEPPTAEEHMSGSNLNGETERKRVHFSHYPESSGVSNIPNGHAESTIPARPSQVVITDDYTLIGGILKISPATQLVFQPMSNNSTKDVVIKLTCVSAKPISYKVKTNNIESYRVKPSIGIIEPGCSIEINVILLSGFNPQPIDKFLIMAMEVTDSNISTANLGTLWKATSSDLIADHKLKCVMKEEQPCESEESEVMKSLKNISLVLSNLENKVQSLDSRQASLHLQHTISLSITVILGILFLSHICLQEDSPLMSAILKYF